MIFRSIPPVLGIALLGSALIASPAAAGPKPHDISWGKPNVSFATYRQDTLDCANRTYGLDVGMKRDTIAALGSSNSAELYTLISEGALYRDRSNGLNAEQGNYFSALSSVEPGRVLLRTTTYQSLYRNAARTDVVDQLQAVLDYCLTQRGYERFRLTDAQLHQLKREPKDSSERAHFLHALGSDPRVLAAQRL